MSRISLSENETAISYKSAVALSHERLVPIAQVSSARSSTPSGRRCLLEATSPYRGLCDSDRLRCAFEPLEADGRVPTLINALAICGCANICEHMFAPKLESSPRHQSWWQMLERGRMAHISGIFPGGESTGLQVFTYACVSGVGGKPRPNRASSVN